MPSRSAALSVQPVASACGTVVGDDMCPLLHLIGEDRDTGSVSLRLKTSCASMIDVKKSPAACRQIAHPPVFMGTRPCNMYSMTEATCTGK